MHMYCLAFAVSDVPKRVSGFRKPFASLATYNGRIYALRKMMQQPTAIGAAYSWMVGMQPRCLLYEYMYDSNKRSLTQESVKHTSMQDKSVSSNSERHKRSHQSCSGLRQQSYTPQFKRHMAVGCSNEL